jgi:hypothetical protein
MWLIYCRMSQCIIQQTRRRPNPHPQRMTDITGPRYATVPAVPLWLASGHSPPSLGD